MTTKYTEVNKMLKTHSMALKRQIDSCDVYYTRNKKAKYESHTPPWVSTLPSLAQRFGTGPPYPTKNNSK